MNAENQVAPEDACPKCGQRDPDMLEWTDDDSGTVRCSACGAEYRPWAGREDGGVRHDE